MDSRAEQLDRGDQEEAFSFRTGNWVGKATALAMVVVFAAAVIWYWEPLETVGGIIGVIVLVGMALACAVWWRVRVDPRLRRVRRYAVLVGVLPIAWRTVNADDIEAVRLHGQRRIRGWHDLWYVSVALRGGAVITLDWAMVTHGDEPKDSWELTQRIGAALGVPVENKGLTYRK